MTRITLAQRLLPGGDSVHGFLAPGEGLHEVIDRDRRALAAIGLTPHDVGASLAGVLGRADRAIALVDYGIATIDPERVEPQLRVEARFYRGTQTCPFAHDAPAPPSVDPTQSCAFPQWDFADFVITDLRTGEAIYVPGLIAHLAIAHDFFEGAVPARVDPVRLAKILETRASHPLPTWRTEHVFRLIAYDDVTVLGPTPDAHWRPEDLARMGVVMPRPSQWEERITLCPGVELGRVGAWCVIVTAGDARPKQPIVVDGCVVLANMRRAGRVHYVRSEGRFVPLAPYDAD